MAQDAPSDNSDERLMDRLAEGDTEALGALYARHGAIAKRALLRFAPECAAADLEDLMQDVLVALCSGARRYPKGLGVERWLWGIAAKAALHWRRKTWLRRKLLLTRGDPVAGLARRVETSPEATAMKRQRIASAIDSLPPDLRDVLVLQAGEGFSGEEIAEILCLKHETVRTRLHRARRRLVELVACEGGEAIPNGVVR